ncbi:MAG: cation-binding protein [Deltaproteobacteria bacterium HGW-Deltaproteobacteria-7]|nr:MAG: cation-binding protein [Deltaproteobacteria bacterium HGW-Deltaproteobacteria-7]PKN20057.1 MAG: cation-binding protein [Deltaproteobacteria bacterium HGW-Deltaproteobacteria-6]
MKPIGPLMWEHRLIEKMLGTMMRHMDQAEADKKVNPVIIDTAVDFIRTYADRTHHGKEEEILFRDLAKKELTTDLKRIMQELLDEHVWGRKTTAQIVAAKAMYLSGDEGKLTEIIRLARELGSFYPRHIEKEDKHFFYPCQEYFTQSEQEKMLAEFWEFDRKMIHEKYSKVFDEYNRL